MFEKIIGKKKSIQRGLVIGFIVTIMLIELASFVGVSLINKKEILKQVIQINIESSEKSKELIIFARRALFIGGFNVIVIGGIMMGVISKKMLKPIQKITDATKKVSSGDFSIRLETKRNDEIGELTNNFNQMVSELGSIENLQKEFVDNVSHEIKTPITSIKGFAELLRDNNLSKEERNEYADIIEEEANRLLNLSTNMLKLSKLQNQNRIVNKEKINLAEQIRKAISLLEPKWKEKEIVFNVNAKEKYFYGDEDLIFQVWVNLMDNAIKFSSKNGNVDIDLKEEENKIIISIKDYGIGMDEEEQKKIFTRFYQIDKSHSEKGYGLGLAIVKRIIELSKGEINITSEKNVGTTVTIKLPIEKENEILIV